jgi:hypothetical protein
MNTHNAAIEVVGDLYEYNFIDKVIANLQFCTLHVTTTKISESYLQRHEKNRRNKVISLERFNCVRCSTEVTTTLCGELTKS